MSLSSPPTSWLARITRSLESRYAHDPYMDRPLVKESSIISSSVFAFDVVPDDNADLPWITKGLYVGTAGNIRMTMAAMDDGTFVTRANVPVGFYPWQIKRIWNTGTNADDMIGDL